MNDPSRTIYRSQRDLSVAVRLALHSRSNLHINSHHSHSSFQMNGDHSHSHHHSRSDLRMNGGPGCHCHGNPHMKYDHCYRSGSLYLNDNTQPSGSTHCSNNSLHKHTYAHNNHSLHSDLHIGGSAKLYAKSPKSSTMSINKSEADSAVSVKYELSSPSYTNQGLRDRVRNMFDMSVILEGRFFWPLLADIIMNLAVFAPIPLISPRAIQFGVTPFKAALLMSIYGILSIVGRFLVGIAAMLFGGITMMLVVTGCLTITCSLASLFTTFSTMAVQVVFYGLLLGMFTSIILP